MGEIRTAIRRHSERALAVPDEATTILGQALVAHVGFMHDGWPYVVPMTFLYEDGRVYIHGAWASRTVKVLAGGAPACIEVTLVDGLIASKSAEAHSVNYRSVLCFGRGALVRDEAVRRDVLTRLIGRYFAGRTAGVDYHPITDAEMKATALVELTVEAMSAKGRSGGPRGPFDDEPDAPGNAGIHPAPLPY